MKSKTILVLACLGCILSMALMRVHPLFLIPAIGCALLLFLLAYALLKDSQTDALTGLSNLHRLNRMEKHYRKRPTLTAVYVDLDDLKQINDTLGHKEGNAALKEVADYLDSICQHGDAAYRIGGDEFLLISETATAQVLSERFTAASSALQHIGISYGIASGTAPLDSLICAAEQNMYAMKEDTHSD